MRYGNPVPQHRHLLDQPELFLPVGFRQSISYRFPRPPKQNLIEYGVWIQFLEVTDKPPSGGIRPRARLPQKVIHGNRTHNLQTTIRECPVPELRQEAQTGPVLANRFEAINVAPPIQDQGNLKLGIRAVRTSNHPTTRWGKAGAKVRRRQAQQFSTTIDNKGWQSD